ncbi:MAG: YfcE family phosphodiesterase [Patescibacteria group bacterium]|jgi:hypothetical protein
MLFAIISDSHDNVPNIDEMLTLVKAAGIENILHCGDVCASSVLKYLAENFDGQIHLVFGNVDGDHGHLQDKEADFPKKIKIYGETGELTLDKLKIAFTHHPEPAKLLAETGKYDLVFYGHTHKPWEEMVGKTKLLNPGTLAGLFARPTFAIYDTATNKAELKLLYT